MKTIINSKRYDTDKPGTILIAEKSSNRPRSDFDFFKESLYRTIRGTWFLAGSGGPMTKYAKSFGNSRRWGEAIIPLTPEMALDWMEKSDDPDALKAIEKYFSSELEDA
jgi:hypothetical protein